MCCPVNRTATKRPLTCHSVGNTFKFNPFTCLLVVQGKQIPMMSGNDIVKLFKRLKRREKKHGTIRRIKTVAKPEVDADMHVEGSVEIAPVSAVPNDAVDEAVETAKGATSRLLMPPPMLSMAASNDPSIVFKKLCDIELPGFAVDSHRNVRFRERDGKVFAPDLLVQMGQSKTISDANDVILKLVKDGTVKDLHSLEVDEKFLVLANKSLILMSLPDAIKLLHRLDVRTLQEDVIMPEIEMVAAADGAQDVVMSPIQRVSDSEAADDAIVPPIGGVSAPEAVQNAIMPQIEAAAASDGMQDVDMPQIEGVSASDAIQDPVMSPIAMAAASGAVKSDFVPPMAVAADGAQDVVMSPIERVSDSEAADDAIVPPIEGVSASEAVQNAVMSQIEAAAASDGMQDVDMPQIEGVSPSDAIQDPVMSPIEVVAASHAIKNDFVPPIALAVASGAARPVAVKIRMRKVQASVLKTISGFQDLDDSRLNGKEVRQVEPGQVDEKGQEIGGKWVVTDGVSACTGDKAVLANQWVKTHINDIKKLAKSLTYIDIGHSSVSF